MRVQEHARVLNYLEVHGPLDGSVFVGLVDQIRALNREEAAVPLAATQHAY